MQIRIKVPSISFAFGNTVPNPDRIMEVDGAVVGPSGELSLSRNYVTFLILPHGKWEEVEILTPPESERRSPEEMLNEFYSVFPASNDDKLRIRLLKEEVKELAEAMETNDIIEIADGVADIVYVAVGTAVEKGIPFDEVFAEVHRSNMTKLGADGKPKLRADGKLLKGENFEHPQLRPILQRHASGNDWLNRGTLK